MLATGEDALIAGATAYGVFEEDFPVGVVNLLEDEVDGRHLTVMGERLGVGFCGEGGVDGFLGTGGLGLCKVSLGGLYRIGAGLVGVDDVETESGGAEGDGGHKKECAQNGEACARRP